MPGWPILTRIPSILATQILVIPFSANLQNPSGKTCQNWPCKVFVLMIWCVRGYKTDSGKAWGWCLFWHRRCINKAFDPTKMQRIWKQFWLQTAGSTHRRNFFRGSYQFDANRDYCCQYLRVRYRWIMSWNRIRASNGNKNGTRFIYDN